jgi:nuclease-like protein
VRCERLGCGRRAGQTTVWPNVAALEGGFRGWLTSVTARVDTKHRMDLEALRPQAGRYAQQRYRAGLKRWRTRVVRPLRWAFLLAGGVLVGAELVWHESLHDWMLGLAVGGLIGLWVAIADTPPAHIEHWLRGAQGERKTERALRPLRRSGWSFAHDLDAAHAHGNRDHVAVGPGGVFLLETKRPGGAATIEGDRLRVQRLDDPDQAYDIDRLGSRVRAEAARLSEELAAATGRRCWVQPVVVVWAPFATRYVESNRVVYLHGGELAAWLQSQNRALTPDRCDEITRSLIRRRAPQAAPR